MAKGGMHGKGGCVVKRGMHGEGGACVVKGGHVWLFPGGHAWLLPGGHVWLLLGGAWLLWGGMRGCFRGHVCQGVCVAKGGMHGEGGHVW